MTHPLPLRVRPKDDETPSSLLDRLSVRCGYSDPAWFGRSLGIGRRGLLFGRGVERLRAVAGFDPSGSAPTVPRVRARERVVTLGRESVALGDWVPDGGRYCASCVADDGRVARDAGRDPAAECHRRFWWDVNSISHCPEHGTPLRRTCPRCDLTAWGPTPGRCRACGFDLGRGAARPAPVPALATYLHARLLGLATGVPPLDGLRFKDVVAQVARIGLARTAPWSRPKPRDDAFDLASVRSVGFDTVADWPNAFLETLDHVAASAPAPRPKGMIGTYGWVYEHWVERLDHASPYGSLVRETLRGHAVRRGVVPASDPVLRRPGERADTTLTAAATELGWGFARTRKVAARRGLIASGTRRGVAIAVDPAELARSEPGAGRLSMSRVAALLGVGKLQAGRLAAAGILGTMEDGSPVVTEGECEAFAAGILRGLPPLSARPRDTLTLAEACRSSGIPMEVLCRLVREGSVRPVGVMTGGAPLARVLVDRGALPSRDVPRPDFASVEEAARHLGLHHETVRHLARRGRLPRERAGRRRGIRNDALRRFGDTHMSGSQAARLMGTSPKAAARRLREACVVPVAAPPECRQFVYGRRDVEALVGRPTRDVATGR